MTLPNRFDILPPMIFQMVGLRREYPQIGRRQIANVLVHMMDNMPGCGGIVWKVFGHNSRRDARVISRWLIVLAKYFKVGRVTLLRAVRRFVIEHIPPSYINLSAACGACTLAGLSGGRVHPELTQYLMDSDPADTLRLGNVGDSNPFNILFFYPHFSFKTAIKRIFVVLTPFGTHTSTSILDCHCLESIAYG
jgi:hypothetical protein